LCRGGTTSIGLLDTVAGDAEIPGRTLALAADDARHITKKMTTATAAMTTAAATAMTI